MSDLDRLLKLSGLVQGSGFEAPVQEGKMSDLDIEAQENSREDFVDMHTKTFGSAEEAGKFWDDSKASRDESNESLETEDYDSKPGEEIAHASEKRKSKKLPYKDWGKAGDPKDDRYRVPKIKTFEEEGNRTIEVNKDIQLAGDSIWDRRNENMTQMVHVKEIEIYEDEDGYLSVTVEHDGPWEIYTDTAFPEAISELCGCEVDWSEQGMQDEGMAHLEGEIMEAYESISETFHTELMRELKD